VEADGRVKNAALEDPAPDVGKTDPRAPDEEELSQKEYFT